MTLAALAYGQTVLSRACHAAGIAFSNEEAHNARYDTEKTAGSRSKEGWSTLGDVGYVDRDGYLYLTDRRAYMIISGGVNIYPQEIENLLVTHPKVLDAAVFGVPNDEFGEEFVQRHMPERRTVLPNDLRQVVAYITEHARAGASR